MTRQNATVGRSPSQSKEGERAQQKESRLEVQNQGPKEGGGRGGGGEGKKWGKRGEDDWGRCRVL